MYYLTLPARFIRAASVPLLLCTGSLASAAPAKITPHILFNQIGYQPAARKVAIISDPVNGSNAALAYTPGTGTGQYQIRRWDNNAPVWTGTLQQWNKGNVHAQSGDRGWWLDFSSLTTPGSYYIYDLGTGLGSGRFEVSPSVYVPVIRQVLRTFYYQRLGTPKVTPYADARWTDGFSSFLRANQDVGARDVRYKNDASTARNLMGGWMDAGDTNKYTTFAEEPVIQLAETYRSNPALFDDKAGIPESGNGLPDILDELKWELDFLKRMQDGAKTGGFILKVGVIDFNDKNGLVSNDSRPRYYVAECTSATLSGAAMFAAAAKPFIDQPATTAYGKDLLARAEKAWARAKVTTSNFTRFDTNCDNGEVKAGDADRPVNEQQESALTAASYLFALTGKAEYKSFVDKEYNKSYSPVGIWWWGPYNHQLHLALLRYASLPNATAAVASAIKTVKAAQNYVFSIDDANAKTDLYRAYLPDAQFHWGHTNTRANTGIMNTDFVEFGINPAQRSNYNAVAQAHVDWLHGANPLGLMMVSNMAEYGAEKSITQIYHAWFGDGTIWDSSATGVGPLPGYLTGGPNSAYTGNRFNARAQPPQKAYFDDNSIALGANIWEFSEPSIYGQASYLMLLARVHKAG